MSGEDSIVIVPSTPGPLVRPEGDGSGRRGRDELDDLIDELLPDSAEAPGLVDAGLLAGGGALLAWSALGSPPQLATIAGVAAVGLGGVLPLRAAWRRLSARRAARRRAALLERGTPVRPSDPAVARLVAAYEDLERMPAVPEAARSAAHGALLEVATLLGGRAPATERERGYVAVRTEAVEELVAALDGLRAPLDVEQPIVEPDLVVEAREELDALGGVTSLTRLDQVTAELRSRDRGR